MHEIYCNIQMKIANIYNLIAFADILPLLYSHLITTFDFIPILNIITKYNTIQICRFLKSFVM